MQHSGPEAARGKVLFEAVVVLVVAMNGTRGQLSVEYVAITAFMLISTGVIFGFALFSFNDSVGRAEAHDVVSKTVNNADLVASLGDGSRIVFDVELPANAKTFTLSGNTVSLVVSTPAGDSEFYDYTRSRLSPANISVSSGRKTLAAVFTDGNVIMSEVT